MADNKEHTNNQPVLGLGKEDLYRAAIAQLRSVQNMAVRADRLYIAPITFADADAQTYFMSYEDGWLKVSMVYDDGGQHVLERSPLQGIPLRLLDWDGSKNTIPRFLNYLGTRFQQPDVTGCRLNGQGYVIVSYKDISGRAAEGVAYVKSSVVQAKWAVSELPQQPEIANLEDHAIAGRVLVDMRTGPTPRLRLHHRRFKR